MMTYTVGWMLAVVTSTAPDSAAMNVPPAPPAAAVSAPKNASDAKPEFPPFEEVVKDMKVREGFITLYHDEKKDKLFARIPKDAMNKNFHMATSIAKGPFFTGWQWLDAPVYWDRFGKKMLLMLPELGHVRGKGNPVQDVISRTYPDSILRSFPILTEVEGDAVVDLAEMMKADFLSMGEVFEGKIDRSLSRFAAPKNFEKNTEIPVDLAIMSREGPGVVVRTHYSLSYLPENDEYKPREADTRVGYFITAIKDWTVDHSERTIFKRYITRWQLRKSEPDKEVSDVRTEDQIVFYIEKTVPVKYRQYVRDGILEWNRAFEAAGLRNAVIVRQQTDKNEYKDLDPEDVRYNFFRWIVTGQPFAMGPSRIDPFTGRILDADIIFDDSYVRYNLLAFEIAGPKAMETGSDPMMAEFLEHNPSQAWWVHESLENTRTQSPWETLLDVAQNRPFLRKGRECTCEMGAGLTQQLGFAAAIAAAGGRDVPEEFIGQAIKETVMHEVGHTLGLRHNFKASSWLTLNDIRSRRAQQGQPTTASVMDYNPYTHCETIAEQGSFATPTIGPYDYWAIEYGYRPFPASKGETKSPIPGSDAAPLATVSGEGAKPDKPGDSKKSEAPSTPTAPGSNNPDAIAEKKPDDKGDAGGAPKNETEMLQKIASRCAEPGLDYGSDEDTFFGMPDPYTNRWDNGSDPVAFAKDRLDAVEKLWKDGLDWTVKDGQGYGRARRVFQMLMRQYGSAGPYAARLVGGQRIHRDHKGDPNGRPPIQPVPVEKQREALRFVCDRMLSDTGFRFSPAMLSSLAPGRWGHWDSEEFDWITPVQIHDWVLAAQARSLFQLMNPFTLNRVYDAERLALVDQDAVTVPEVLEGVTRAVWSELSQAPSDGKPDNRKSVVSSYRRTLQRNHLERMTAIVTGKPGRLLYPDVHSVTRLALKRLGADIDKGLQDRGANLDEFTRAHWIDSRRQIERALSAEYSADSMGRTDGGATMIRSIKQGK